MASLCLTASVQTIEIVLFLYSNTPLWADLLCRCVVTDGHDSFYVTQSVQSSAVYEAKFTY